MTLNLRSSPWLLLLTPLLAHAAPILTIGTPGVASEGINASPGLSTVITFSTLSPFSTFAPGTYSSEGVDISSVDGLEVLPFSVQTNPNYLFDESSDGTADIDITTATPVEAIGVGIADSDMLASGAPVPIELEALLSNGTDVVFPGLTLPENPSNPIVAGNGYFVVSDSTADIVGLEILQPVGNPNFGGLAIAPVEVTVTPEPVTLPLLAAGLLAIAGLRWLRKCA